MNFEKKCSIYQTILRTWFIILPLTVKCDKTTVILGSFAISTLREGVIAVIAPFGTVFCSHHLPSCSQKR